MAKIRILGFGASLRKGGFSTAILESAKELVPEGATLETFSLEGIPAFNQDIENSAMPKRVKAFKKAIRGADALLIVTPEYNYSVPGYLKNAIDWASRPDADNSFIGKPASVMSSSDGQFGGIRASLHMRQIMLGSGMHAISGIEVKVTNADEKIKNGKVTDKKIIGQMKKQLKNLTDWAILMKKK